MVFVSDLYNKFKLSLPYKALIITKFVEVIFKNCIFIYSSFVKIIQKLLIHVKFFLPF